MERVASHANVIVPEVLKNNNYKRWSILMRYYLVGQDLWDVVQLSQLRARGNMRSKWMKKNALALHAIMISCGEEIFDQIKEMKSAKEVWDALANMYEPQPIVVHSLERRRGSANLGRSQNETLTNAISNGKLSEVKKFFQENSNARSARIFENRYTVLHFAVYNKKEEIVDYLIRSKLSKNDLEIQDDSGSTALSIAACFGVGKSIAQKLVRKNKTLLTIPDNNGKIPVQLACTTIQEDMTRYLYRRTPLQSLNLDNGFDILQKCITRKMFDIAFDLLHHFPEMASPNYSLDSGTLILTLAQTVPPFFKRSNLSFWDRFVYDSIRVKASVIKKDEYRSCVEKIQYLFQICVQKIQDFCKSRVAKILALFHSCEAMVQYRFQSSEETIQEIFQQLFEDFCGYLLEGLLKFIIAVPVMSIVLPVAVLLISVSLIGMLALIMLPMLLILGKLIYVALRILVSMLSRFFAKKIYAGRLMDKYACEVIHLICQPLSKLDQNDFVQSRAVDPIFKAIKNGIPKIVIEITKDNANILWSSIDPEDLSNIFASAVVHRQEEVAHFLYSSAKEEKSILFTIDEYGNNTLHLAAKLAPHYQLGYIHAAALQLQSELRWFKAVKGIVPRAYNEGKNKDDETPLEVFVREHKDLLKEAEEWVKKTAESATVVGALIITVMFAVAFTVPGGNDSSTGFPIGFYKTPRPFMIFVVSDAISLFAASSSVIMFLGILTSHHADEDYRKSSLLIIGLTSLFISIATMMIAFCAALFIMLQSQLRVVITITLLAGIPIACFVWLQLPLLVEILVLTFNPNIFGRKQKSWMRMTDMFTFGMRSLRG